MKRKELLNTREYWISKIQIELFDMIEKYRLKNNLTKTELAKELGFSKGYITQILNGDFDHKISKLVDLALSFGKVPMLDYVDIEKVILKDSLGVNPKQFKEVSVSVNYSIPLQIFESAENNKGIKIANINDKGLKNTQPILVHDC